MRRREFIALLGAAGASARPQAGRAEQAGMRRVGVLFSSSPRHWPRPGRSPSGKAFGRSGAGRGRPWQSTSASAGAIRTISDAMRRSSSAYGRTPSWPRAWWEAAAISAPPGRFPVVFAQVQDPLGGGFVTSLSRPDGNLTGFTDLNIRSRGSGCSCWRRRLPA